jgi:hypothetical protein
LAAVVEQDRCSRSKYIKKVGIFARHFRYIIWYNFLYQKYTKVKGVI